MTQQQSDLAAEICHKITVVLEMLNQDLAELKASIEAEAKEAEAEIAKFKGVE